MPTLLWRNAAPANPDTQWLMQHQEARKVAAGALSGFVVHAMVLHDHDGYLQKQWDLIESAGG